MPVSSWAYLPFNGGARLCLGQQYALHEAMFTTFRLVQEFATIEPRDDSVWTESLSLTCAVKGGVKVGLIRG